MGRHLSPRYGQMILVSGYPLWFTGCYQVVVFFLVRAIRISLCNSILLIGLCHDLRISCNSWFYFLFDMICMSLDMICISKRAINCHPSISIKANGITSYYSGQPPLSSPLTMVMSMIINTWRRRNQTHWDEKKNWDGIFLRVQKIWKS